jgi:hypothetical protein
MIINKYHNDNKINIGKNVGKIEEKFRDGMEYNGNNNI